VEFLKLVCAPERPERECPGRSDHIALRPTTGTASWVATLACWPTTDCRKTHQYCHKQHEYTESRHSSILHDTKRLAVPLPYGWNMADV